VRVRYPRIALLDTHLAIRMLLNLIDWINNSALEPAEAVTPGDPHPDSDGRENTNTDHGMVAVHCIYARLPRAPICSPCVITYIDYLPISDVRITALLVC